VIDGRKLEEYFESFKGWCEERWRV
jgi:hypothetical protein